MWKCLFIEVFLFFTFITINDGFRASNTQVIIKKSKFKPNLVKYDELFGERIESGKFAASSVAGGIITSLPIALIHGYLVDHFNGQWEFREDMLSLILLVFGLTYRYGTRGTKNDQIRLGIIGSFIITRTLSEIHVPATCSSVPLDCGAPFHYVSWSMISEGLWAGGESALAFGGSALFIDFLIKKRLLSSTVRA